MSSALKANGSTHQWRKTRETILRRDSHTCHYCGRPANTVDHRHPRSLGGTDDHDNLVACCAKCNTAKGNGNRTRKRRRVPQRSTGPLSLTTQPATTPKWRENFEAPSTLFPSPEVLKGGV